MNWQPIETAPKGGGADRVDDPLYVEPPTILLYLEDGCMEIGYWDWYYAEGGNGFEYANGISWVGLHSGRPVDSTPTHWMPLPEPPK